MGNSIQLLSEADRLAEDGANWLDWKMLIECMLQQHGCEEFTHPLYSKQSLEDPIKPEGPSKSYLTSTERQEMEEKKQRESTARTILVLNVKRPVLGLLRELNHPADMWQALCTAFQPASMSRVADLNRQLHNCEMSPTERVDQYMARFTNIVCALDAAGERPRESSLVHQLLYGLPMAYQSFVSTMESAVEAHIVTFAQVKARLKVEEAKIERWSRK